MSIGKKRWFHMLVNCHSYFSIRYGTISPRCLVQSIKDSGYVRFALTDINNVSASLECFDLAKGMGLHPVIGVECRDNGVFRYVLLAMNDQGLSSIHRIVEDYTLHGEGYPIRAPYLDDVVVIYRAPSCDMEVLRPYEYIGIRHEEWSKAQHAHRHHLDKLVIWHPVVFRKEKDFHIHRLLQCIDQGSLWTTVDEDILAHRHDFLLNAFELETRYAHCLKLVQQTNQLLDQCRVTLGARRCPNRKCFTASTREDQMLLTRLAAAGLRRRFRQVDQCLEDRLNDELNLIFEMNLQAYFLITWKIVDLCAAAGIVHVGRGSGANSLVAYCLHITDVDPVELNLLFERFINRSRGHPPDFDLDFSWKDRDDVLSIVTQCFGEDHVALLASYQTYKGKSIVREVGKVLGLSKRDLDLIVDQPLAKEKHHPLAEQVFSWGRHIRQFPSHFSIHAGGVIVTQHPIPNYTARTMMPRGFPIVQLDMHHAERWGFHKYDLLSQRGIGHIEEAVDLIREDRGLALDVHDMEMIKQDPDTLKLLAEGSWIGCFYIESPAMRGLLHKLQCRSYLDLIVASSIIRPGVARSGMMRKYLDMKTSSDGTIKYIHPVFDRLAATFGIMVFQEDVMWIVHAFAGFDMYHADLLRRLMTGKEKSPLILDKLRDQFFEGAHNLGRTQEVTAEVWRQIESFSGYAFCKAHSATYAAESMQSLYLKAHFPLHFITAVINNHGGFYPTEFYVHEARKLGAVVHPPCLIKSGYRSRLIGKDLYLGWDLVKGLRKQSVEQIVAFRAESNDRTLKTVFSRLHLSDQQWLLLIRIGAFRNLARDQSELIQYFLYHRQARTKHLQQPTLFHSELDAEMKLAISDPTMIETAREQMELFGFPLCNPFDLLKDPPVSQLLACELPKLEGRIINILGYYVLRKPVTTIDGGHMCFATWLDQAGDYYDSVHFPVVLDGYPIEGKGCYRIVGKVLLEHGYPLLEARYLEKLAMITENDFDVTIPACLQP